MIVMRVPLQVIETLPSVPTCSCRNPTLGSNSPMVFQAALGHTSYSLPVRPADLRTRDSSE